MRLFSKKEVEEQDDTDEFGVDKSQDISNLDDFLDSESINGVYPFSWEEFPDHIESGDNYIRVLAIVDYPKVKSGNWLAPLKRKKGISPLFKTLKVVTRERWLSTTTIL